MLTNLKNNRIIRNIFKIEGMLKNYEMQFAFLTLLKVMKTIAYIISVYFITNLINRLDGGFTIKVYYFGILYFGSKLILLIIDCSVLVLNKRYFCNSSYTVRKKFYEKMNKISPSKLNSYIKRDLVTRFTSDLDDILEFSVYKKIDILANTISLIIIIYYIATYDWRLIIVAMILFSLLSVAIKKFGKKLENETQKLQEQKSKLNTSVGDIFDYILEIKSFEAEDYIKDKNYKEIKETEEQNLKVFFYERIIWASEILFQDSFSLGYFIIGAILAYFGKIDFSLVVGLMFITGFTVDILFQVPYLLSSVFDISPKIERFMEFIEIKETDKIKISDSYNKYSKKDDFIINTDKLTYGYNEENIILKNISLTVSEGEKLVIVGKSGSGKSTLLRLITGYDDNYDGKLKVFNTDVKLLPTYILSNNISYYPQESFLFKKSILENFLLFSEFDESTLKEKIKEYESIVAIGQEVEEFTEGYETIVDLKNENISKGQLQRLCLLICLMKKYKILLIDEGFSAIDFKTTKKIINNILTNNSKTVIMVMHQISEDILNQFDSIIVMDEGEILMHDKLKNYNQINKYINFLS